MRSTRDSWRIQTSDLSAHAGGVQAFVLPCSLYGQIRDVIGVYTVCQFVLPCSLYGSAVWLWLQIEWGRVKTLYNTPRKSMTPHSPGHPPRVNMKNDAIRPARAKALTINAFALAGRIACWIMAYLGRWPYGYALIGLSVRIIRIFTHSSFDL